MSVLIEKTITENIILDSPMEFEQAVLYGVTTEGEVFVLGSSRNVYALLANDYSNIDGLMGLAFKTMGWAAPLEPETGETSAPPSIHPTRTRIVFVATLTTNGFCSAMKSERRVPGAVIEETKFDEGPSSGALWDAMNECLDRIMEVER